MEEKKIAFSFSKIKQVGPISNTKNGNNLTVKYAFEGVSTKKKKNDESDEDEIDIITEISDKKVKSTKSRDIKKVPIIELKGSKRSAEDMDAIRALIEDATNKKLSKKENSDLKIESLKPDEEEAAEDPDYEKVCLEDFGLACLRGMGWNDNEGIGKTNKQKTKTSDIVLRPRGLGLGASFNSNKKNNDKDNDVDEKLIYAKGAYLEILDGKYSKKYAQLISFDDGLNRIMVKILDDEQQPTISILQSSTKLVSKSKINSSSSSKR
jgi:hypothetical protein